ncbi:MAG: DUF2461 domain-containing protein [Candidatus Solibacter usitatus]|nr:DUF2461 domain-containing protein [Candidatus Solibacter usitatus]
MGASFEGFSKEALKFLRDLEKHNNRDWFEEHKPVYISSVKEPMEALTAAVGAAMTAYAPEFVTEPRKAIYRIYRDTRFSKDKTPYKTHAGASFWRSDLGKHTSAGFYFEVSHKHVGVAGGVYMPDPDNLRLLRVHIMENHQRWTRLLSNKKLRAGAGEIQGERLSRPPKGFPCEHPAMESIRLKQMYFWQELPATLALTPVILKELTARFRLMTPVLQFMNEPLEAMKKKRAPLETGWI